MYVRTKLYVRRASPSSSMEYANAGQAMRNAVSSSTIADATRTAIEYSPTSCASVSLTRKKRSLKFVSHRASADGTSGRPNRFIAR